MHDRKQFYRDRIAELDSVTRTLGEKSDRISRTRLFVAVLIIGSIYLAVSFGFYYLWLMLLLVILFFRLVQHQVSNANEMQIVGTMASLSRDELSMLNGDHSVFDPGPVGGAPGHIYATDLDIFGTTSLFKVVNRTVTHDGRSRLIDMLLDPLSDTGRIAQRKEAVVDLEDKVSWRQRFFAIGSRSGETPHDMTDVALWIEEPWFFDGRRYWLLIAGIAGAVSLSLITWMIIVAQLYLGPLIALLIINSSVFQLFHRHSRFYFNRFGSRTALFRKFALMFRHVISQEFQSSLGKELKGEMTNAAGAFTKLSRLHNLAEQRANGLVSFIMNGLFLFDVWTLYRIETWRRQYKSETMRWVKALGHIDLLSSCANFKFNHPSFTVAEVTTSPPKITAVGMSHPLIPVESAVANDYQIGVDTKAHIITGSNMAGKSTFIRAVGLNVILALNGLPVCARHFTCSAMKIASCIRITDSLEDHASYFKAELDRLGVIVKLLQSKAPYLVLLDEILRGTNSDDKRQGTLSFYRKLASFNCISLLATHDLAIGELERESPGQFANYCFESKLEGSEILFDYRLKRGVSTSANATFLMRRLNLID